MIPLLHFTLERNTFYFVLFVTLWKAKTTLSKLLRKSKINSFNFYVSIKVQGGWGHCYTGKFTTQPFLKYLEFLKAQQLYNRYQKVRTSI